MISLRADLIRAFQGVQGELIRFAPTYDPLSETSRLRGAQWQIDPSLDPSLTRLVEKILPLATFYTAVSAFVDLRNEMGFGMVCHALASGIRGVLRVSTWGSYRVSLETGAKLRD